MAEPLILSDSPLAQYLSQSVPSESHYLPVPQDLLNPASTMTDNPHQSFVSRLPPNNPSIDDSSTTASSQPLLPASDQTDQPDNQLSERLKYLICSSFLLNPDLQPDFYDSHATPPMLSELVSFNEPSLQQHSHSLLTPNLTLDFIKSFRFFRPHPRVILSLSTLLILIGYHVSPLWALFSLPVFALTLFRPRSLHRLRHIDIIPHLSPRSLQLEIQSAIVPEIAELVNKSQALDLRVSRAIGAVKEIECVALGLGLSNPMPPVSRLETAAFPLAGPSQVQQTSDLSNDNLHALGVRKVLQRVLDQARHEFENTAVELESVIIHTASSTSGGHSGSSTLSALMEMYGCSRISSQESQSSLRGSATERARRQAWRASLHSRIHDDSQLVDPIASNHQHITSTPPSSKRLSLQTPTSPNSVIFESLPHLAHLETRKLTSLVSRQPRSRSSFGTPSQSHECQVVPAGGSSPTEDQLASTYRCPPRSRPSSFHISYSPTSAGIDGRRSSLLMPSGRSPRPRPCSMSAASLRTLSAYSPSSRVLRLPELYPEIVVPPSSTNHNLAPKSPVIERVLPYSLAALQNTFERMHISRKRMLCCLLALDFTLFTPNTLPMWQDTLETVQGLLKTVETLGCELTAGMASEFGPGSFETTPVARPTFTGTNRNCPRVEQEDVGATQEVRDFAPPIPEAEKKAKRHGELLSQMQVMDLALRAISAKMKVCVEELEQDSQHQSHGQRAINVHESIRSDLESLAREWDGSRSKIRDVVEGEKVPTPGRSRLRPHSLDSNEGCSSMSSGRASSIYSSEVLTPVGEHGPGGLYESEETIEESEDAEDELGPLLGPAGRGKSMAPPPGLEELLAGAVAPKNKAARRSGQIFQQAAGRPEQVQDCSSPPGPRTKSLRLSAEEQLELTRRRRESAIFTPRSRPLSLLHLHSSSPNSKPDTPQPGIVTELKDVLHVLKARRASSIELQ